MAYNLKENLMKEDRLAGGHRMCAGCGSPIAVRTVLRALNPEDKAVVCSATSCLEVSTFMYPYTSWKDSFIISVMSRSILTMGEMNMAWEMFVSARALIEKKAPMLFAIRITESYPLLCRSKNRGNSLFASQGVCA